MSKISDFKIVEEKLDEKRQDYMGSKYSQHLGGSITEEEMERQKKENDAFAEKQFWREIDNEDYTKKQTFSEKKKMLQREKIVSSGQILGDLRPKLFLRKLNAFLESITPEEVETLVIIKNNFFNEWKRISMMGTCAMLPIFYHFRSVVSFRFVFVSGVVFPVLLGFFLGGYRNSKKSIILMDKLGSEYTMSRIYKQTIFTKRRDLSDEVKAEIYMKMNKENKKLEEDLLNNSGLDKL